MQQIQITQGYCALVDDDDFAGIAKHRWYWNSHGAGYAARKERGPDGKMHTVVMHRVIMNAPAGVQIDHINGNGLDNRKENLRFANTQKNAFNRRKPCILSSSKYKGVLQRSNTDYWLARLKYNNKHVELGRFANEADAGAAYNFASRVFFGDYRKENDSTEIEELPEDIKDIIFMRCKKKILKEGWKLQTGTYQNYNNRFDSAVSGRVIFLRETMQHNKQL